MGSCHLGEMFRFRGGHDWFIDNNNNLSPVLEHELASVVVSELDATLFILLSSYSTWDVAPQKYFCHSEVTQLVYNIL